MANKNDDEVMDNKSQLLSSYSHYSTHVRRLEEEIKGKSLMKAAEERMDKEFQKGWKYASVAPWSWGKADKERQEIFEGITREEYPDDLDRYCYVSLKHTTTSEDEDKDIFAAPSYMKRQFLFVEYPTTFDKYTVLYDEDLPLKYAVFIVDGKKAVSYYANCGDVLLTEAFQNIKFITQFQSMLYVCTMDKFVKDPLYQWSEGYAAMKYKSRESALLNMLGQTTEISRDLLRDRYPCDDFLTRAENDGLVVSKQRFRDFVNVRNLMYHQTDMLTQYREFVKDNRHDTNRCKLLSSYESLFDKPLRERLETYIQALDDFREIVKEYYPNFLYRQRGESNSKFVARLKEYHKNNPEQELLVELNYPSCHEKREKLINNIGKLFPKVSFLDDVESTFDSLDDELDAYDRLNCFTMLFQNLESTMTYYSITRGNPQQKHKAVKVLQADGVIDEKMAKKIDDYRELRNCLSHNYYTKELAEKLKSQVMDFAEVMKEFDQRLGEKGPVGKKLHDSVYRFYHKDGQVVDVDFNENTVTEIEKAHTRDEKKKPDVPQCEELVDGTKVDYKQQKIDFSDNAVFYFNSDDGYCLVFRDRSLKPLAHLWLDDKMAVKSCVINGKKVSIRRGDMFSVSPYRVMFDKYGKLSKYIYNDKEGKKQVVSFNGNKKTEILLEDGTVIGLNGRKVSVVNLAQLQKWNAQNQK